MLGADPHFERVEARALTGSVILHVAPGAEDAPLVDAVCAALAAAESPGRRPETGRQAPDAGPRRHSLGASEIARMLDADATAGLNAAEAASRLGRHGPSLLPQEEQRSRLSLATGGVADAAATLAVVLINGVIGYVTEGQAESAIHALMDPSGQSVTVVRGGQELTITASALVPGDLVQVRSGTQIAADARLVAARRLLVDESAFTGETVPVEKSPDAVTEAEAPIGARPAILHSGTIVAERAGSAIVVATGSQTAAARIVPFSASRPAGPGLRSRLSWTGSARSWSRALWRFAGFSSVSAGCAATAFR